MRFTEDRISHLSHLVWDALYNDDLVDYPDDDKALLGIKSAINQFLQIDNEIDNLVRKKIESLKRGVTEGSREWEILYKQYYEEEANRRRY